MIRMVATDLDGTLLDSSQNVSNEDFRTLELLGDKGVIRVIATGRSPFSFQRIIPPDFPIDYLIFSSGAGIMDYQSKEILISYNLPGETVHEIALWLRDIGQPFKVLAPVPDNHHYVYYQNGELHSDFIRRMENYRGFEKPISFDPPNFGDSSQFLIILPPDPALYVQLKSQCNGVKVIRATSPIDHQSIWMEIYHKDVSKGNAISWLCNHLNINQKDTVGIGNDYNDAEMLEFVAWPYLVENSPSEMKALYPVVRSNNHSGFTHAVTLHPLKPINP